MKRNVEIRSLLGRTFSGFILLSFLFTIFGNSWGGLIASESYSKIEMKKFGQQSHDDFFELYSPDAGDGILLPEEKDTLEELKETNEEENKNCDHGFDFLILTNPAKLIIDQNQSIILSNQDYTCHLSRSLIILYHAWKGFIA